MRYDWVDCYGNGFWQEEEGVGVVEIILILVILVALVLIFKNQIVKIIKDAFDKINTNSTEIQSDITEI
jgi:Flp pilus assembly pilin Flp